MSSLTPKEAKLMKRFNVQKSRYLEYDDGKHKLTIGIPESDLENKLMENETSESKEIIKRSINLSMLKYFLLPERKKKIERNVCNFAQDIVLLYLMGDPRVKLV